MKIECTEFCKRCLIPLGSTKYVSSLGSFCSVTCALDKKDQVNHPPHYQGKGIEVIDIIEAFNLNFVLGNAVKYILRAGKKGDKKEDIEKAIWYLNRELKDEGFKSKNNG